MPNNGKNLQNPRHKFQAVQLNSRGRALHRALPTAEQETKRRQSEGREEVRKFRKSTTDPQPAATVRLDTAQKTNKQCVHLFFGSSLGGSGSNLFFDVQSARLLNQGD